MTIAGIFRSPTTSLAGKLKIAMPTLRAATPLSTPSPILSIAADVCVALACAALIPGATPWLPLVPLLILLPHWADRIRLSNPRPCTLLFVPDPKEPDWRPLAQAFSELCRRALEDGEPQTLCLTPFCRPDGSPRPYAVDYQPSRQMIMIHECGESRPCEHRLAGVLRPRLPLPLIVGAEPVMLRIERLGAATSSQIRLLQLPADRIARSPWAGILLPALIALFNWRLSGVVVIALLTPLLARTIRTPFRLNLFPFRHSDAWVSQPALPLRFDLLRLWLAGLVISRQIFPATLWGAILRDPLALLFWGLMAPLMIAEGLRLARERRQRRTVSPS